MIGQIIAFLVRLPLLLLKENEREAARERRRDPAMRDATLERTERLTLQYRAWATRSRLLETGRGPAFHGTIDGREVALLSGLDGSQPRSPEIVVYVALDVERAFLVDRATAPEDPLGNEMARLVAGLSEIRTVGVTKESIRLRFTAGTATDVFDDALARLDVTLREIAMTKATASPYRA